MISISLLYTFSLALRTVRVSCSGGISDTLSNLGILEMSFCGISACCTSCRIAPVAGVETMADSERSRSPLPPRDRQEQPGQRQAFSCFPRWYGPMGSAVRSLSTMPRPQNVHRASRDLMGWDVWWLRVLHLYFVPSTQILSTKILTSEVSWQNYVNDSETTLHLIRVNKALPLKPHPSNAPWWVPELLRHLQPLIQLAFSPFHVFPTIGSPTIYRRALPIVLFQSGSKTSRSPTPGAMSSSPILPTTWWSNQPADAVETAQKVAVMMGIPVCQLQKNFNATNPITVLTVEITMTYWLAPLLRKKLKHKVLQSYLHLIHAMILVNHFDSFHHVIHHLSFSKVSHQTTPYDGALHHTWSQTHCCANLARLCTCGALPWLPTTSFRRICSFPTVYISDSPTSPICNPIFCIGSAMHIFSSATTILFKLNSLVGSGVSIKISTFGPRFLFLSAVPTIDALNLYSFKNGNLGWTIHSFANFSTLAKGFWRNLPWIQMLNLDWPPCRDELNISSRPKSSGTFSPQNGFRTVLNCGTSSTLWDRIPMLDSKQPTCRDPIRGASPFSNNSQAYRIPLQAIDASFRWWHCKPASRASALRAPWSLSPNLQKTLKNFLRQWHLQVLAHQVPCHVPSFKAIFVKHPSVLGQLCNHKQAVTTWSTTAQAECRCKNWSGYKTAVLNPSDPHWVLSRSLLTDLLPPELAVIAEGSLLNKVSLWRRTIAVLTWGLCKFSKWAKDNGLPSIPKSTIALRFFKPSLRRPKILWQPLSQISNELTASHTLHLLGRVVNSLLATSWQKRKSLPNCGRPIISFVDSPFRPMLNILARMIFKLIPAACPKHFAIGDVYALLKILREAPERGDLILFNQDLAGFFASIDMDNARFLGAWYMLLDLSLRPNIDVGDTAN